MTNAVLGIIGGSGIYDLPGLENVRDATIESPWGEASAPVRRGVIAGLPIVFLPRHGRGHVLSPSDINYRANIDVLKRAGVTDVFSLSACGSFREELSPGTFVLIDQFIDRTFAREKTFFGTGCVAHVSLAESNLYKSWGCSVIGMTNMPEAKLAREAELPYCTVAMVTDYDSWHPQ